MSMGYGGGTPWLSLGEFAGFRDRHRGGTAAAGSTPEGNDEQMRAARRAVAGRLAVPPPSQGEDAVVPTRVAQPAAAVQPAATTAADRVREKLLALKSGGSGGVLGRRVPGIVAPRAPPGAEPLQGIVASSGSTAPAHRGAVEASGGEILVFKCTGPSCRHTWVSGRGATSFEQICKQCGASVVGVLSKGAVLCESVKFETGHREVLRIQFDRPLGKGLPIEEVEGKLLAFVQSELRFLGQFFKEDGVTAYIARRRGEGSRDGEEARDGKQDVRLVERFAAVIQALCKAEFEGSMRGGEADAKIQGLLDGLIDFRFVSPPTPAPHGREGSIMTVAVDFASALDVEDRISDKVDARIMSLRKVMREMDKKLLEKPHDSGPAVERNVRSLLGRVVSGLDWNRALSTITGREGHDRLRCMTCRFIGEDCSQDVVRSQELRRSLRRAPGFVFVARIVLGREDRGGKNWEERTSALLEGVAGTRGGECFMLPRTDAHDRLEIWMYSQPEWLGSAVDRIITYAAQGGNASLVSNLVGLGRVAKGLRVVEPAVGTPPRYDLVSDTLTFLDIFASRIGVGGSAEAADAALKRVRWNRSSERPRSTPIQAAELEKTRSLFRQFASFEDMDEFVDFLRDFRQGTAKALAKPEPRPPRPPGSTGRLTPAPSRARSVASSTIGRPSPSPKRNRVDRKLSRSHTRKRDRSPSDSPGSSTNTSGARNDHRPNRRSMTPPTRRSPSYG